MAVKKSKDKISLEQFRSWLQGVEDMQPDDWIPNAEQWKRIREKIDQVDGLIEPSAKVATPSFTAGGPAALIPQMPRAGSAFDNVQIVNSNVDPTNQGAILPRNASEERPFGTYE